MDTVSTESSRLPSFDQMVTQARACLSDARDWLACDWRDGTGPTDAQAAAKRDAMTLITQAKIKLEQARR